MDFLIDALMELMPDAIGEWLSERFAGVIARVKNPIARKAFSVIALLLAIVLSVALSVGLLFLIGFILFRIFKL